MGSGTACRACLVVASFDNLLVAGATCGPSMRRRLARVTGPCVAMGEAAAPRRRWVSAGGVRSVAVRRCSATGGGRGADPVAEPG